MDYTFLFIVLAIIFGFWFFFVVIPINLWITAQFSNVRIGLFQLLFMRIRKVPPGLIVRSMITAHKSGIEKISTSQMETHYLAHGNLTAVIKAMIMANKANLDLDFRHATAIDLAGRNVLEAVKVSVTPYMVIVPAITGISADGIQLIAEARVTVRTNLKQLVGGAGEETIQARVGQGIISSIGNAKSYLEVLENPEQISKQVLNNGLDAGTAYEILSIDIADINIGINIGAKLQIDQANADLNVAKAKAEEKRAMAVALEQEMIANVQEAKAMVILAEAEIPAALSEALKKGLLMAPLNK
ncbi:MAG: flotillin-like protein FloA [Cyclobacteriaceae bacterium]|nr:flotillin-like protein FloA [Cyclobacteriaceae bacterium]